ncbi:MAG TPA: DUF559 domain-containing protein [Pseudonocardiaceae bacterium]|nr:DUF559 domain-containing protein [Pseudonocardiaceae bacterium]
MEDYLRRQAGVIGHGQARATGMSGSVIKRRVTTGKWLRLHPRVYLAADCKHTDEVRLRAAVLWAGTNAVAHGVSAAWWYGLGPRLPRCVEVTVPRQRWPGLRSGIQVRRRDIDPFDLSEYRDLPVTGLALTVLEAAVALGPGGAVLLDRALQQHVTFGVVYRAHCRNLGRSGSAAASDLLTAAADRACSQAERLLIGLLRGAGITGWELNYRYQGYVIDVAFPAQRLAIEIDGWAWHVTPERFVRDRQRQNAVVNGHWRVLRFTWHDLTARQDAVLADIRTALAIQ